MELSIEQLGIAMDTFGYETLSNAILHMAPHDDKVLINLAVLWAVRKTLVYDVKWTRLEKSGKIIPIREKQNELVAQSHPQTNEFREMIKALMAKEEQIVKKPNWLKRLIK